MTLSEELEKIKEYFEYRDGAVYREGKRVGWVDDMGYRRCSFKGKKYREHQLVFALLDGYIPKCIDHIDGNRTNNERSNLRAVTHQQNIMNAKLSARSSTGHKGVCWDKSRGKYLAYVYVDYKRKNLGRYSDFEQACLVADEARALYHGDFARKNA
jgi:hypothetical protein